MTTQTPLKGTVIDVQQDDIPGKDMVTVKISTGATLPLYSNDIVLKNGDEVEIDHYPMDKETPYMITRKLPQDSLLKVINAVT